jgi:hypothetical protein
VIIPTESCLRRIPVALDAKQAFFLEGIRVTIEMIDLAHCRLQSTLLALADSLITQATGSRQEMLTSAMLDAWSIIDSVHRLRNLAHDFPQIRRKKRIPAFHYIQVNTESVEKLRNSIQHLHREILLKPLGPEWSTWGVLTWCVPRPNENIQSCMYHCGKMKPPGNRRFVQFHGRRIRVPVGLITLTQDDISVCISDIIEDVERVARTLEDMVQRNINRNAELVEHYGADIVLSVMLAPLPEDITRPPQQEA